MIVLGVLCRTNELVYTLVPIKRRSRTYVTFNAGSQAWRVAQAWALIMKLKINSTKIIWPVMIT